MAYSISVVELLSLSNILMDLLTAHVNMKDFAKSSCIWLQWLDPDMQAHAFPWG